MAQNQDTSSAEVAALRGAAVRLSWRPEHVVAIPGDHPAPAEAEMPQPVSSPPHPNTRPYRSARVHRG
jgi:putative spermidine/putrescine transport system ATP-binding protein